MSPAVAAAPATVGAGLCLALAWGLAAALALSAGYVPLALTTFIAMMAVALAGVAAHHPFDRVGAANLITGCRAVITALIAGALIEASHARAGVDAGRAGDRCGRAGRLRRPGRAARRDVERVRGAVRHGGGRVPDPGARGAGVAVRQGGRVGAGVGADALRVRGRRLGVAVAECAAAAQPPASDGVRVAARRADRDDCADHPAAAE